jgi:ABC-type transport system involved in multi-copper enzyme maturation permease subunit
MINPILERELKTRMRTWRTPIILLVYLLFIAVIVALFFLISAVSYSESGGFDPMASLIVYNVIIVCEFGMLMFIVPAFTATSISGERERQTLDLLLCTSFSTWKIIFGKIGASLAFVFLMIIASLPFIGIVFLYGGVSVFDIVKVIMFFMISTIMAASIGMFCSTHFKKNITSIVMSYLILFALLAGTGITFGLTTAIMAGLGFTDFLEDHVYDLMLIIFAPNPSFGLMSFIFGDIGNYIFGFGGFGGSATKIAPWMVNIGFDGIFSGLLLWFSKIKLSRVK